MRDQDGSLVGAAPGTDGAWAREARRVRYLAAELNITVDEETLILSDVREVAALRLFLQVARRRGLPWPDAHLAPTWPPHWAASGHGGWLDQPLRALAAHGGRWGGWRP